MARISLLISDLFKRPFVRNIAIFASGTTLAQIINMAFSPVITRIYGPEAFGLMGVFMSLVNIVIPIAALTYPIAIVLPKEDEEAMNLVRLSLVVSVGVFILVSVAIAIAGKPLFHILDSDIIAPYAMLIPLSMLFAGLMQIGQQWLIRGKQFNILARVAIVQAFILNIAMVVFGWFRPVAAILVVFAAIRHGLHAALLFMGGKVSEAIGNPILAKKGQRLSLKKLAQKYYDFPLYRSPQVLINGISQSLPVLLLASLFGPASAGFYTLCRTVLGMPYRLVGAAIGGVFYPRMSEAVNNRESLTRLLLKSTMAMVAIGVIPFSTVVIFGPWLFSFVFGTDWLMAGHYARWISIWIFCLFSNRPSVATIPALRMQKWYLIYEVVSIPVRVAALYAGYFLFQSDLYALGLFSVSGVVLEIWLFIAVFQQSHSIEKQDWC